MGLYARPQPGALLDLNVAQVQCQRLFASLEQHSDGGRSVSAHNDTGITSKFRTALFSENGKTNPLTRFHLYVIVAHSRRSARDDETISRVDRGINRLSVSQIIQSAPNENPVGH